ncbi:hypothetical protein BZA70DRAFT_108693 [Myxozyma melibiosi]|uniref:Amidohydrolase-related domain-containing protein n=1 Tax=Myxozyma melibiosi TaxID=54550 RepID=A0ABR1FA21_9ASCO
MIIDSHVHLFASHQLDSLAWMTQDHILHSSHGPDEYATAASQCKSAAIDGYIVVEADWRHTPTDYSGPLEEFKYHASLVRSKTRPQIKALVPWAPLPWGASAVASFLDSMRDADPEVYISHVRGVRYLAQDFGSGSMTGFTESMKLLASRGLVAEVGVKIRGAIPGPSAVYQLEEALELIKTSPKTRYIFDHLCKPDLRIPAAELARSDEFSGYSRVIAELARYDTYIKLSGGFSELDPTIASSRHTESEAVEAILPWVEVVFSEFGPRRVMFGSDWPVSTIAGGPDAVARWLRICGMLFDKLGLDEDEREAALSSTALSAYNVAC